MTISDILAEERFVAVDVGASHGLPDTWKILRRSAFFYLIEPDREACMNLHKYFSPEEVDTYKLLPVAVSGTGGSRKLFMTNAPTGSSLLTPNSRMVKDYGEEDYFYPMKVQSIDTISLSDLFDNLGETQLDLFKLDIQGAELEVLQGLDRQRMDRVLGVELEIGMPGAYIDQAQFSDIQPFMEEHGLELFDLRLSRVHIPKEDDFSYYPREIFKVEDNSPSIARRIWEVDALFVRNRDLLIDSEDSSAIRRLIVVYCTYRFFAEAYHLVTKAENVGLFDEQQASSLHNLIVVWHEQIRQAIAKGMQVSWLRQG